MKKNKRNLFLKIGYCLRGRVTSTVFAFLILLIFISSVHVENLAYKDGVINISNYGAIGDGETNDTDIFRQAIEEFGSDEGRIEISNGHFWVDGITFPSNIKLTFQDGGTLYIPEGEEIKILGSIEAGIKYIFSGDGGVTGSVDNLYVYPQWFGAFGDDVHDDGPALQRAANLAVEALGKTLFIPDGKYFFRNDIEIKSNVESRGLLVKEIEIDEEKTRFSNFTFVPTHYPKNDPQLIFAPDNEEIELNSHYFLGIREGEFEVPVFKDVPLANGNGQVDLSIGGTLRFYSTDFFSPRKNLKGDQFYDKNDMTQIVSGRGDIFPEFAFSYPEPPAAAEWQSNSVYEKGDYVSYQNAVFKATWPSGEGAVYKDRYLGIIDIGPVKPQPEKSTTQYNFVFENGSEDVMNIGAGWKLRYGTGIEICRSPLMAFGWKFD
jgi:hypothetical protein